MAIQLIGRVLSGIVALAALFLFAGPVEAGTIVRPPNNLGLVGYWKFDEGTGSIVGDFSGRGHYGTTTNIATPPTSTSGWTQAGRFGGGLKFDGSDDQVWSSAFNGSFTDQATLVIWLKKPHGGAASGDLDSGFGNFGLAGSSDHYPWSDGNIYLGVFRDDRLSLGNIGVDRSEWHMVAITNAPGAGNWRFYQNAVLKYSAAGEASISFPTTPNLGKSVACNCYLQGTVDEMRIYNRALSETELMALYRAGASRLASSATLDQGGTLKNGLVGHWTYDAGDTAWLSSNTESHMRDRVNGRIATSTNMNRRTATTIGKIGQAFDFDGTDDYQRVIVDGTAMDLDSGAEVTVAAWVWVDSFQEAFPFIRNIVGRDGGGGATTQYVLRLGDVAAANKFQWIVGTNNDESKLFATDAIETGKWYHVVGTLSGTTQTIYVNGVGNSQTAVATLNASALDLYIGALSGTSRFMDGRIDDVRVYNRALSATEVKQLYNLGAQKMNASSQTLSQGTTLLSGLIGHWTFDGTDVTTSVVDKSGQGLNAAFVGGATSSAKAIGKLGQALRFAGDNDYIVLPTSIPANHLTGGTYTLSAWVNARSLPTWGTVLKNWGSSSVGAFHFGLNAATGKMSNKLTQSDNTQTSFVEDPTVLPLNTWVHYVTVADGSTLRLYRNGVSVGTPVAYNGTLKTDFAHANIGAKPSNTGGADSSDPGYWNGLMDDVRIYNRPLTREEVVQLYNLGR